MFNKFIALNNSLTSGCLVMTLLEEFYIALHYVFTTMRKNTAVVTLKHWNL